MADNARKQPRKGRDEPAKRRPVRPGGAPAEPSPNARSAALLILDAVLREKRLLSHVEGSLRLPDAEAARAGRLARLVLRHVEPLDTVIGQFTERAPQFPAALILRLAAAELLISGEDAHGVVHSAVALAKARPKTRRAAGMINAVLRKVATDGPAIWATRTPQRLPGWIGGPIKKRDGAAIRDRIEAAHEAGGTVDLTFRDGPIDIPDAMALPTGGVRLTGRQKISALPGFAEGKWWVQDAAAALPVRLLGDVSGQRVLDLCAAPGGKTLQLAAAGAEVTALDLSSERLGRLRENLARTNLRAKIVEADAFAHEHTYDAILLDAPCSATGTIRRHPDLPFVKSWREVEPLSHLQMRMIEHALGLLNPGGRLVFCTCSLLPVEGELQTTAALKRHPDLRVVPFDPVALGGEAQWASPEGGLRLRPDFWEPRGGLDGFYMVCLMR